MLILCDLSLVFDGQTSNPKSAERSTIVEHLPVHLEQLTEHIHTVLSNDLDLFQPFNRLQTHIRCSRLSKLVCFLDTLNGYLTESLCVRSKYNGRSGGDNTRKAMKTLLAHYSGGVGELREENVDDLIPLLMKAHETDVCDDVLQEN